MDRLNQLRGDAGTSKDSTLDASSRSEAYVTANESSKYFSLSEVDSSCATSPSKVAGCEPTAETEASTERLISNLSPIPKKSEVDSFKIGEQIEAANILSGGVNIFDDNENSYDEDELVIDDAVQEEDKSTELKSNDNTDLPLDKAAETNLEDSDASPSKETEVSLHLNGRNVDAIDIGNGLYLYRSNGDQLSAIQILQDEQPNIKFLKVRENAEGNLEVYEEIEIEVPKEVPTEEGETAENPSNTATRDVNIVNEQACNKVDESGSQTPKDTSSETQSELNKESPQLETKPEVNLNGKMMKFSESRKSPVIGTFTPMTYHSTPNKEGIPLTKTMVDLQLHPSRHSENVKKTIEVPTDSCKQRLMENPIKTKNSDLMSLSIHKEMKNNLVDEKSGKDDTNNVNVKATENIQGNNKQTDDIPGNKKLNEKIVADINNEKITENSLKNCQQKLCVEENLSSTNVTLDKTDLSEIVSPSQILSKPVVTAGVECGSNVKDTIRKDLYYTNDSEKNISLKENRNDNKLVTSNVSVTSKINLDEVASKKPDEVEEAKLDCTKDGKDGVNSDNSEDMKIDSSDDHAEKNNVSSTVSNTEDDILQNTNRNVKNYVENEHSETTESTDEVKNNNDLRQLEGNSKKVIVSVPNMVKKDNKDLHQNIKLMDQEKKHSEHETKKIFDSLQDHKTLNDIEMKEPDKKQEQQVNSSFDNIQIIKPDKILEGSQKEALLDKETKNLDSQQIQSNICRIVESNCDLKQTEKLNIAETAQEEKELKQIEKVSNIAVSNDVETQNNADFNKSENKGLQTVDKLKINTVTKSTEQESTLSLENLSENFVKDKGAKSKQADKITSNKLNPNTSKLAPSASSKSIKKGLELTEKNVLTKTPHATTNSAAVTKSIGVDVKGVQKKTDPIKTLPVDNEVKIHSSNQQQKEIEKKKCDVKKELLKPSRSIIPKPINNNKVAVPFGKWTEANRQEFLNKIKEAKVPTTNTSNTKQLKQPNDLNRRDVLQKIDSQRQSTLASARVHELNSVNKSKNDTTVFGNKSNATLKEMSADIKVSVPISKADEIVPKTIVEKRNSHTKKIDKDQHVPVLSDDILAVTANSKKDPVRRKEINNQDLIDKTIEGIINRAVTAKFGQDEGKPSTDMLEKQKSSHCYTHVTLDEIESKMNELHGIPFVERPPHELPKIDEKAKSEKSAVIPDESVETKGNKIPKPLTFSSRPQQKPEQNANSPVTKVVQESDEEIIEHEPVTGDSDLNKSNVVEHVNVKTPKPDTTLINVNSGTKKESIITENDFDKFARRNSYEITYEKCLTVNFDGKEQHNVVQTVEKEIVPKKLSRNEIMLAESKAKSTKHLPIRHSNISVKNSSAPKLTNNEDLYPKNYQSKVQIAYQSAMTAKRQQDYPITIIEDQPVKVVFMDSTQDLVPQQLNLQGKELSPPKKTNEWDHFALSNSESIDSDVLDSNYDTKSQDDTKSKSKHQRKQVLNPVEAPELELIEPSDLGVEVSPKKKRKIEDSRADRSNKTLVPKKSYLLNRNIVPDDTSSSPDLKKPSLPQASVNQTEVFTKHSDPISAIDNLVKAAELLETQSENKQVLHSTEENPPRQDTPTKRGRGRPRKHPLPDTVSTDSKSPSPVKTPTLQKKPRLIDAKIRKVDTESEDDELSSDSEMVKENWTMGKINENIVCPICNKLFRSENVVFKHVKHCSGPSPSRSDSDKRSPRRMRQSQELDWKSEDNKSDSMDVDEEYETKKPDKKIKSKVKNPSIDEIKTDVIIIEDTPIKESVENRDKSKLDANKTIMKPKVQHRTSNHVCEFCGKTFRQLSYLVSHKLQHKNAESKKMEKDQVHVSLFSCEICKKEFRKLHHLVQHRIIHNSNPMSSRSSRKSSSEQSDTKTKDVSKASEDQSAGFRCEPCDKSFRKLHHLVEHRETHDEMNKKCTTAINTVENPKPNLLHNCDVCKKSFKKLQHLIEHKEHHLDTSSEKSDDKSVKSSLSTKDIIHECPLCYMVFPNEHSLNKHNIICQKKKKQSASKNIKNIDDTNEDDANDSQNEETKVTEADAEKVTLVNTTGNDSCIIIEDSENIEEKQPMISEIVKTSDVEQKSEVSNKDIKPEEGVVKSQISEKENKNETSEVTDKMPLKSRKPTLPMSAPVEIIKIPDTPTPKKKLSAKDKTEATITKRQKTSSAPLPEIAEVKHEDSSDDDEIRYMLNPDFVEESKEGKLFMKVRAKKRNSLQIERPNSKDLVKRRISLQHPPKIPRLKVKPVPGNPANTNIVVKSTKVTPIPSDPVPSTDSDDSDVKYSFPVTIKKEVTKDVEKKVKRQTIVEKRRSLGTIAKRKSVGKVVSTKHKASPLPTKPIKRRITMVEHRCDCGQLFSSAALLSRHTTLAHTPPRIRRRRSPPPDEKPSKIAQKRNEKPASVSKKAKTDAPTSPKKTGVATRKSSVHSDVTRKSSVISDVTRKSSVHSDVTRKSSDQSETKTETRKAPKSALKTRRTAPHKGVPVPEKMRKLMDKSKK